MAQRIDDFCGTDPISLPDRLIGEIQSWFRARREKFIRNRDILQLLSYDDRLLKDMGFSRAQLVEELGYDPLQMQELFRAGEYRLPHL